MFGHPIMNYDTQPRRLLYHNPDQSNHHVPKPARTSDQIRHTTFLNYLVFKEELTRPRALWSGNEEV